MTQPSDPDLRHRRTFWVSVSASVVASIFFALFFQPTLTGITNFTVSTIGVFYSGYVDGLYNKAAQNPVDSLIYTVFGIIAATPMAILVSMVLTILAKPLISRAELKTQRLILIISTCILVIPLVILVAGPAVSVAIAVIAWHFRKDYTPKIGTKKSR
jgi:hypothetical protein